MTGAPRRRRRAWIAALVGAALALTAGWVIVPRLTATTTTVALAPLADTYVRSDAPTASYGTSARVSVQTTGDQIRAAYLRYSVVVPIGAKIKKATLRLRAVVDASHGGVELRGIETDDWSELTTWAAKPATARSVTSRAVDYAVDDWIDLDATDLAEGGGNLGLALTTPSGGGYQGFSSRESAHVPQLLVTMTSRSGAPSTATTPAPSSTATSTLPAGVPDATPVSTTPEGPDGTQAAEVRGWGPVSSGDEFNYVGVPDPAKWKVYDSAGHNGQGIRSPGAVSVDGTQVKIVGDELGTTGGMSSKFDRRKYGRWETRMRSVRESKYHPVLLLWPDSKNWPCDGEVDYAEGTKDTSRVSIFLHYGCENRHTSGTKALDVAQWHNYAVEWTGAGIVGFVDGKEWFRDTQPAHQPPGPMHQTVQLDWAPEGIPTLRSEMMVDWVRVYDLGGTAALAADAGPPAPTDAVTIAAIGDMNGERTVSVESPAGKNGAAIAGELKSGSVNAFLGLGDFQYDTAFCADYVNYWARLWGGTKSKLYWISGPNHDWEPGRNEDLDNFMNGQCPGDKTKSAINAQRNFIGNGEPYSFDLGAWHFAMLSSALWQHDRDAARAATTWLDRDLAAAKAAGKHLAVALHDPYFTSNTASHSRAKSVKPWIDVMDKHDVRLTLSGSQHNYERSCPVLANDTCTAGDGPGTTAFQVSTGGVELRPFTSDPRFIEKRFSDTHGWLKLWLEADGGFAWEFMPVSGPSSDRGSRPAQK